MFVKLHKSYRIVVAVCDEEIVNKKFEEGIRQIEVRESFYKDQIVNHQELVKLMQQQSIEDSTFNIVGEKSVKAALEAGIISEEGVIKIQNVPIALVLL